MYIPVLSSMLPAATPGPHKTVGFATVRAPAREWVHPASPTFKAPSRRAGQPALRIVQSAWGVYYPASEGVARSAPASPAKTSSSSSSSSSFVTSGSLTSRSTPGTPTSPASLLGASKTKRIRARGWSGWGRDSPAAASRGDTTTTAPVGVPMVAEPVAGVMRGYDRYFGQRGGWLWSMMAPAVARYTLPLVPNAPLAPSAAPYPLVIFSHGICGTRTTYGQYCQALASEGYVVVAVEHADGTSPCVLLPDGELSFTVLNELDWRTDEGSSSNPSPTRSRSGSRASDSSESSGGASSSGRSSEANKARRCRKSKTPATPQFDDLYALQIDQRVRELYAAHEAFCAMLGGERVSVDGLGEEAASKWAASFAGHVDVAQPVFAGHSFGAATVFRSLEAPPPDYAPLTLRAVVALDHWWEPFPKITERPPLRRPIPPVLAINSQEYTQWRDQWPNILKSCTDADATLVTILGTTRTSQPPAQLTPDESFCDAPLLWTMSPATERAYLATMHSLTCALLDGTLARHPAMQRTPDNGDFASSGRKMVGNKGDVVVHLVGQAGEPREGHRKPLPNDSLKHTATVVDIHVVPSLGSDRDRGTIAQRTAHA